MPRRNDIETILILGAGPIVIGQACEFDYSGTQACRALKKLGYRVVLLNSNPATIMTDPELADATYIEPVTPAAVERILEKERPQAILPTMGGQTALNVAVACAKQGMLEKYGVELIGAKLPAIEKAEDRELFKEAMVRIGMDLPRGGFARNMDEAMELVKLTGYPAIIRSAFTLGGTGGSIAYNVEDYREKVAAGMAASPIGEVLVEESILGWKEYELEVMRDLKDNVVIICSIENLDPMGVHTGDSITVAPAQTLTDREYQLMRDAAVKIIREIGVETGGSNIQFGVHPETGRMVVIEMNPRVSRSSALASKATGFPIAKIAAQLAVGLTLDEITNDITGVTPACFEPALDYVVVKIPRWDFEKFPKADPHLGTQMKSVGEAMAIGRTFPEALGKALRSLENGRHGLGGDGKEILPPEAWSADRREATLEMLEDRLRRPRPDRLHYVREALRRGVSAERVQQLTRMDPWFVQHIVRMVEVEDELEACGERPHALAATLMLRAKQLGLSDRQIGHLTALGEDGARAKRLSLGVRPVYKTVDTCAAEFPSQTPYLYSTYETEDEAPPTDKKKVIILGGGPNRIGQGIEFDYCAVRAVMAFRAEGYETHMINCNPETVSTDYDLADRLYFEPLTFEDVMHVIEREKPFGVVVQFGGQTPLRLARRLEAAGVPILGTSPDSIDLTEDRGRFGALLKEMGIRQPEAGTAFSAAEALDAAHRIGYPVLVRPSYVLGGRAMEIVYDDASLEDYIARAAQVSPEHPILIDRFLEDAFEFDVDAVCDGVQVHIGGIMQHIEEAGVHSGDSSCVLPPYRISEAHLFQMEEITRRLALRLKTVGLINLQFAIRKGQLYVLEVNPRASRTVPFVAKATGVPLAMIAAKVMGGRKLKEFDLPPWRTTKCVAVKSPVFPFVKFPGVDNYLGPEMKSTGEVMGLGATFGVAFAKAMEGAGHALPSAGNVFLSVNDGDKEEALGLARDFHELGFGIYATRGTQQFLSDQGVPAVGVNKSHEERPTIVDHLINGEVQLVINTPLGRIARQGEYAIGRNAMVRNIPCLTTLSAAWAAVDAIRTLRTAAPAPAALQELHRN